MLRTRILMRRIRKTLKWMGLFAVVTISLLLLLNAWYVWSTGTRLERQLVELRAAGEPVQLADLARPPIPPEENAAVLLRRAADDLNAMQKELTAWFPLQGYPTGSMTSEEQDKVGKLFDAYPKVLPLIEQAADCSNYDSERDYTLSQSQFMESDLSRLTQTRVAFRVLRARTAWLLAQDRRNEAFATALAMFRLARHLRREPLIVGYLVTLACEGLTMEGVHQVLQSGPLGAESRHALDTELALRDNMDGYRGALRSERAFALSAMRELPGYDFWFTRGFANDGTSHLLALMGGYLADAGRPYQELAAERKTIHKPNSSRASYRVAELLRPALDKTRESTERIRASGRALRVLNALQSRAASADGVPDLAELGLPQEATIDPFNGKPLIVKRHADGWMVYSVGPNLKDDGGKLDGISDVGVGPR